MYIAFHFQRRESHLLDLISQDSCQLEIKVIIFFMGVRKGRFWNKRYSCYNSDESFGDPSVVSKVSASLVLRKLHFL